MDYFYIILVFNMKEDKSLSSHDITILSLTLHYIRKKLGDYYSYQLFGMVFKMDQYAFK